MNSRVTLGLAGLLLLGAVVAGYWGLTLSRVVEQPEEPELVEAPPVESVPAELERQVEEKVDEQQRSPVVVLARTLKPLTPIVAEDLALEQLRIAPPNSFATIDGLLGRSVWRELPAGSVLNTASFEMGGPLARMIRAEERALAVAVDEVIGGGGHLSPGDYVDVLLYLRQDEKNRDQTAQVLIPALRVLSFGDTLGATNNGEAALPTGKDDDRQNRRPTPARTAVLAVPAALQTRFMLATQVGTLRLSVRSAEEKLLAGYYAGEVPKVDVEEVQRQLYQFEKLALRTVQRPQSGLVQRAPVGIQIYRGTEMSRQNP